MTHRSRGFTLIELLLTSTIGLLIMASVFTLYKSTQTDERVRESTELIRELFADGQSMTATRSDFLITTDASGTTRSIAVSDIINARGIDDMPPGSVATSDGLLTHPFLGDVSVSVDSSAPGANDLLNVTLDNVPTSGCLRLLNVMAASVYDMKVNGNLVGLTPAPTTDSMGRDNVRNQQAGPLCAASAKVNVSFRKLKEINYYQMRREPFGDTLSPSESALITPLYDRTEAAMAAREAAQVALP